MEQMQAIQEIVETGEIGDRTLSAIATQLEVEPSKLQEHFAPVMAEFERQGRAVFSEGGLDADEVIAYAQQNEPDKLNIAMRKHATQRSTAGYADLRQSFLASLGETNPQRALTADLGPGVTTYQDSKGRVMVRIPGYGEMAWRQAIEAFHNKS
jgi:hypothetical protein